MERNYMIFDISEIDKVDFTQILETSSDTLRKSADGTKTFVKWVGETPFFFNRIISKKGPYTYSRFKDILLTFEWVIKPNNVENLIEL